MNRLIHAPAVLDTPRLRLRFPHVDDAESISALADNPRIAHMTGTIPSPYPRAAADGWIASVAVRRQLGEVLAYVICDRQSEAVMGVMSLTQFKGDEANLAYWLGEPFWGNGFCTEAGEAVTQLALGPLGLTELVARRLERNAASGRVLVRLGFQPTVLEPGDHRGTEEIFQLYVLRP